MKISGCLRNMKLFRWIGRDYSVGKTRGPKEGPIDSGLYELPVSENKKTCKGQNKKSGQHNGNLDKGMEWKGAASVHGRIEVGIAWSTIRRTHCDYRNAGHQNADDYKQDEMFFSNLHKSWSIVSTVFRNLFKTPFFAQASCQALHLYSEIQFSKAYPLYPHCGIKTRVKYNFGDVFIQSLLLPVSSG